MRGADALIAALERQGVTTVFGVPGGAALPLYDALASSSIRHVLTRHEAAAGHAARHSVRVTLRIPAIVFRFIITPCPSLPFLPAAPGGGEGIVSERSGVSRAV